MGLFPVIAALPRIRRWFSQARRELKQNPPDALLLVDYPGFNLRLAAEARKLGIPVIYYISPQVWAWKEKRVETIRRLVDLMIVILPFEVEFYRDRGLDVFYPGHPLADRLALTPADPEWTQILRDDSAPCHLGIFPGSRRHVVKSLLPTFLDAWGQFQAVPALRDSRVLIAAADQQIRGDILSSVPKDRRIEVVTGQPFEVMAASDLALTTSGTTTLELAGHSCPMVLAYRVSPLLYGLGRRLIKVPHIGLVNLIARRRIIPEHIGWSDLSMGITTDLLSLAQDNSRRLQMVSDLEEVRKHLGGPGSYQRTGARILSFLES